MSTLSQKEQLAAWELWKEICSVTGCHPESPDIQEKIARNNGSLEKYQRYYDYLFVTVSSLFNDNGLKRRMPSVQKRDEKGNLHQQDREDFCREFDSLMLEYGNISTAPKAYKDKIWYKACNSSDPAVQVICGQIKWLMPALAEKYLRNHYDWMDTRSYLQYCDAEFRKKSRKEQQELLDKTQNSFSAVSMTSLQTPLNRIKDNYRVLQDILPSVNIYTVDMMPKFSEPDQHSSVRIFYESLSVEQKIVLFAMSHGFNVTGELVQRTLGKGKNYCSQIRHGMMRFIAKRMARFYSSDISWINTQLKQDLADVAAAAELLEAAKMQKEEKKEDD